MRKNMIVTNGRITSINEYDKNNYLLTMYSKDKKEDVFAKFIIAKTIIDEQQIKAKERVVVKGYLKNKVINPKKYNYSCVSQLVATEVSREVSLIEKYFGENYKGKNYEEMRFSLIIEGKISKIVKGKNGYSKVFVSHDTPLNSKPIESAFDIRSEYFPANINANDEVLIIGGMTSKCTKNSGKTIYYDNFTITDIVKK